ncbi:polymorphic toxin-type HINT domain-containing protein [Promicromonospora xylanilytica]
MQARVRCLLRGRHLLTADGTKPIEDIRVGDKVWTRNLVTWLDELQLVAETFVHQTLALYHLTINGATVSTTAEYPFMVEGRGWQMAGNLRPGDVLITPDGATILDAIAVEERDLADIENVYNLHVENNHNYYVHAGDTPILVHNNHGKLPKGIQKASKGMKDLFADGSVRGKPIISIRDTLKRDGFTQELAKNKKGYLFRNSSGEKVRVMRRNGAWDIRARNGFGNYRDEFGNVAAPGQTHQIGVVST